MAIILNNFVGDNSFSAVWKIEEDEHTLHKLCSLSNYDKNLLDDISSTGRRLEILSTRAALYELNPDITITYEGRKPICNKGYISISHSDTLVAVIWHPTKQVSVDIEKYDKRIIRIAKRAFSPNELNFANDNIEILTKIWSCKECVYKIVNKSAVEFKKQITISDFHNQATIKCLFIHEDTIQTFYLKHISLCDHALVWGVL
ncbi:MAG: 4'-phosphopantetheinyl transferase superfamily protein [Bacteroidales bacterium]|nr:4'-phosphopantetheinyl transferase superfamily protein [Bacteroidales bacterium]MDD4216970.1 4'-phosphopantetheinyl transferase superfamily protein [Bacteroidales bacterium]